MANQSEVINSYLFNTNDKGELEVSFNNSSNKDRGRTILIFVFSLTAVISAFFIDGDLKYVFWIIGGMMLALSLFAVSTFFKPMVFVVTDTQILMKGRMVGTSVYNKEDIVDLTYDVEKINRSATSMMGKEDVPFIRLKLKDGSNPDLLMIEKKKSGMTRTYEEEAEAKQIISLIKKKLGI